MRMLNYFINRAGRGLSAERKAELQKAKTLLSKTIVKEKKAPTQKAA
jgi:tRNA(adenine34) deaminase